MCQQYFWITGQLNVSAGSQRQWLTHQWVWRWVIQAAVGRRTSVIMSVLFIFWRNYIVYGSRVVVLCRRCGDIIRCPFLFCVNIEAEEYHSYGHHQDWESRDTFQSFSRLFTPVAPLLHGETHSSFSFITYIYWKIFSASVMAGIMSICWHFCGQTRDWISWLIILADMSFYWDMSVLFGDVKTFTLHKYYFLNLSCIYLIVFMFSFYLCDSK